MTGLAVDTAAEPGFTDLEDSSPVTFGWDASHYDGTLDKTILTRAYGEGIRLFTHKLGESLSASDGTAGTALAGARDAGIPVLGGYWFCHGRDNALKEAKAFLAAANTHEPWWPEVDYWFWQPDWETNAAGLPSRGWGKTFCDYLFETTGRNVVIYASRGMYGNRLGNIGYPLWNADYGSNPKAHFAAAYPGNNSRGWTPYSGQTPKLLQFGSNTTIAGRTTCDANAFRGTVAQLQQWIGSTMTNTDINNLVAALGPALVDLLCEPANAKRIITAALAQDGTMTGIKALPDGPRDPKNPSWSLGSAISEVVNRGYSTNQAVTQPAKPVAGEAD